MVDTVLLQRTTFIRRDGLAADLSDDVCILDGGVRYASAADPLVYPPQDMTEIQADWTDTGGKQWPRRPVSPHKNTPFISKVMAIKTRHVLFVL